MRFRDQGDLDDLVSHRIPESASLEYKRELSLGPKSERLEALKDISAMGNGGGGTVIYGMDEDRGGDWPVAKEIVPQPDFGLLGKLENIWRDGVRPPLLVEPNVIEVDGGYVLAVNVRPSPLGPYMIEAYGDRRHYVRTLTSAVPMTEQQVRDAYALALRAREHRPDIWADHALPMTEPTTAPWMIVSAMPEEPLAEILDMRTVEAKDLQPSAHIATYINNSALGGLTPVLQAMGRWVDGFYGVDDAGEGPRRIMRIHRDGAAAIAISCSVEDGTIWPVYVARLANAALLYLGELWRRFDLRSAVEIRIDLHNTVGTPLLLDPKANPPRVSGPVTAPPGLSVDPISTTDFVLAGQAARASIRHQILMRFADRLYQAGGEREADAGFRLGLLHDQTGVSLGVSAGASVIWDANANMQTGWIHTDGAVTSTRTGQIVAWYFDGVVLDMVGDAVAVLELAPGVGCPDDFVGTTLKANPAEAARSLKGRPTPPPEALEPPKPSAHWSTRDLRTLLDF